MASKPSTCTDPLLGGSSPSMILSSVDLPAPLGPSSPMLLFSMLSETSFSA